MLLGSHGGNNGIIDDYFRDLKMATGLRVFKIHLGAIGNVPGLTTPRRRPSRCTAATPRRRRSATWRPELVQMERGRGLPLRVRPDVGYSFKGQDAIESWVSADLSKSGAIGNPHPSDPEKGKIAVESKVARLAQLLEAIYRLSKREIHVAHGLGHPP